MKHTSFVNDIKKIETFEILSLGQALEVFGTSSFGMIFFILGTVIVIPTGIIPGIAVVTSICISILALQYAVGVKNMYVPKRIKKIIIPNKFVVSLTEYVARHETRIESVFVSGRYKKFLGRPYSFVNTTLLVLVAITMIPLTLLPVIEMVPGFIVMIYGLALLFADGKIMMLSWIISIMYLTAFVWFFSVFTNLIF